MAIEETMGIGSLTSVQAPPADPFAGMNMLDIQKQMEALPIRALEYYISTGPQHVALMAGKAMYQKSQASASGKPPTNTVIDQIINKVKTDDGVAGLAGFTPGEQESFAMLMSKRDQDITPEMLSSSGIAANPTGNIGQNFAAGGIVQFQEGGATGYRSDTLGGLNTDDYITNAANYLEMQYGQAGPREGRSSRFADFVGGIVNPKRVANPNAQFGANPPSYRSTDPKTRNMAILKRALEETYMTERTLNDSPFTTLSQAEREAIVAQKNQLKQVRQDLQNRISGKPAVEAVPEKKPIALPTIDVTEEQVSEEVIDTVSPTGQPQAEVVYNESYMNEILLNKNNQFQTADEALKARNEMLKAQGLDSNVYKEAKAAEDRYLAEIEKDAKLTEGGDMIAAAQEFIDPKNVNLGVLGQGLKALGVYTGGRIKAANEMRKEEREVQKIKMQYDFAERAEKRGDVDAAIRAEQEANKLKAEHNNRVLTERGAMERALIAAAKKSDWESYEAVAQTDPEYYKITEDEKGNKKKVFDIARARSDFNSWGSRNEATTEANYMDMYVKGGGELQLGPYPQWRANQSMDNTTGNNAGYSAKQIFK
jgi:hypothetical protein